MQKIIFFIILSVCIIVPFSNDIFAAAFPVMEDYFQTSHIHLVLSIGLLGLALAQPLYGPLSDRFGRRPVLLTGLWIYTLASVGVLFAPSFPLFLLGRLFQAIGACSILVSVLAIIRDSYPADTMVKYTSIIMAIIGAVPAIAPLLGASLTTHWGWQANFIFLLLLGVFFTIIVQCFFQESQVEKNMSAAQIKQIVANYRQLLLTPKLLNFCIISACSYGILFSYIALSPFFIIKQLHFTALMYGCCIAFNGVFIFTLSLLTPKIVRRFSIEKVVLFGLLLIMFGGVILFVTNTFLAHSIFTLTPPMLFVTAGVGLIRPTASAGVMSLTPKNIAGTAAALFAFCSFVGGFFATTISSMLPHSVSNFSYFIMLIVSIALLAIRPLIISSRHHLTQLTPQ